MGHTGRHCRCLIHCTSHCKSSIECELTLAFQDPYDSLPAFQDAYRDGSDAVKGDFRVTKDNIGVVCHSSPIQAYESPLCVGRHIENMTAAQVQRCPMTVTNRTFITVPTLLHWASENQNVMLCVKASRLQVQQLIQIYPSA
jgi:hypothetical protein